MQMKTVCDTSLQCQHFSSLLLSMPSQPNHNVTKETSQIWPSLTGPYLNQHNTCLVGKSQHPTGHTTPSKAGVVSLTRLSLAPQNLLQQHWCSHTGTKQANMGAMHVRYLPRKFLISPVIHKEAVISMEMHCRLCCFYSGTVQCIYIFYETQSSFQLFFLNLLFFPLVC